MNLNQEDIVLKYLIQDPSIFNKAYPYLAKMANHKGKYDEKNFFEDTQNRKIFSLVKENFNEYSSKPSFDDISLDIMQSNLDVNEKENIQNKLQNLKKEELSLSKDKTESLVSQWIASRRFLDVMVRYQTKENNSEINISNVDVYSRIASNVKFTTREYLEPLTMDGIKQVLEYCTSERNLFSSGLRTIDDLMGGYGKGIVIGIGAFLHVGKTAFMSFIARNALKEGRNVLFMNGESIDKQVSPRIIASLMGYTIDDFSQKGNIEDIINSLNQLLERDGYGRFIIYDFPAGGYTTDDLDDLLHDLRNTENPFIPDIICLDYIQLWDTNLPHKNNYEKYGFATTELSNLARFQEDSKGEKGITIFLGMQLNKTAHEAVVFDKDSGEWESEVGNHMIQDSVIIPQKCDVVLFMANNKQLQELNQTFFYIGKNRQNGVLSSFLLSNDFSRMEYYDLDESNTLDNMISENEELSNIASDMQKLSEEIQEVPTEFDKSFNVAVKEKKAIEDSKLDNISW